MEIGARRRLVMAVGVSEWQTFIEHAKVTREWSLVLDLQGEQLDWLVALIVRDGYLFYPGETCLSDGPRLARKYCTEHLDDVLNLEREET